MSGAVEGVALLPCPFCGGEGAARSTLDVPAYWFGICLSCETMTGYSTCEVGATMIWNRRNKPRDESTITDRQINAAIRHGFGDRFADDVDDPCGIRKSITDDQFESLFVALHRIKCNPSMDEIALVMPEVVAILQPDVLRDRIAVLERENRNYAKTMDIIGQLPAALTTPPARSYADGVEDAAKVADAGLAQWNKIVASGGVTVAGILITEEEAHVAAGACEALAAAIRLLSQGGKA